MLSAKLLRLGRRTRLFGSTAGHVHNNSNPDDTCFDLLVVGGGVMGVWSAIAAVKRGATVALADQFEPAHALGSSHGDGRIFRLAYEQDHYVDMMEHSLPLWHDLQATAGIPLMATTGGVTVADRSCTTNRNDGLRALYERRGIAHQTLSAAETNARFPQYSLAPNLEALYQPAFGVLFASKVRSSLSKHIFRFGCAGRWVQSALPTCSPPGWI
jgi:glycine/D-amino acid oxidase-like deaminating enzyme